MKKFNLKKSQHDDMVEDLTKGHEVHEIEEKTNRMDVGGKAKVLDKPELNVGKTIPAAQIEEIIKTTDSMQIVAKAFKNTEETDSKKLQEASRAILKSYDLAVRKIKATYEDVLDTKKSISNEFLTVQILIRKYEQFPDIKQISDVITTFSDEVETLLSYGKGVWLSNDIVLEAADYINKMIPIARIITPDTIIVNMLKWGEVADNLIRQNKITVSEKGIIEALVGAINQNLKNGYYVKFGNLIIARINPHDSECMILFSGETILRMNKIYSGERNTRNKRTTNKLNYLNKFMSSVAQQKEKDENEIKRVDLAIKDDRAANQKRNDEIIERDEDPEYQKDRLAHKFDNEFSDDFEEDLTKDEAIGETEKEISENEDVENKENEVSEEGNTSISEKGEDSNLETKETESDEQKTEDEDLANTDHVEDYVDPNDKKAVRAAKRAAKKKSKEEKRLAKIEARKMEREAEAASKEDSEIEAIEPVEIKEDDSSKEASMEESAIEEMPMEESISDMSEEGAEVGIKDKKKTPIKKRKTTKKAKTKKEVPVEEDLEPEESSPKKKTPTKKKTTAKKPAAKKAPAKKKPTTKKTTKKK